MSGYLLRLTIIAATLVIIWLVVAVARRMIAAQRRLAFAAPALPTLPEADAPQAETLGVGQPRILAFSSADCRPCHTLQQPALERVLAARQGLVSVTAIDAPSSPELTERYHVLTVPTTVVLDAQGKVRAVNYGFTPAQQLLAQLDTLAE